MPINRQAYTKKPFPRPASGGVAYQCNPANYGNATTKVINLYNNTWLSDSVVFTVDSAWRYVVHVRNTHNGASSIHIDDVRVYGMNTATYLACDTASGGYRYGFNGQIKDDEVHGIEGTAYDFGARLYDSRIAKFLSLDPMMNEFPYQSSYLFAANNPIYFIDKNGEFKINPKIAEKYPKLYKYITTQLYKDVENSADIVRVFSLRTRANRDQVLSDFENNSGPELIFETSPGADDGKGYTNAAEYYSQKHNRIEINKDIFDYVEGKLNSPKSTKHEKQAALLLFNLTLFHGEAHRLENTYGENEETNGSKGSSYKINKEERWVGFEAGYDVEFYIYGIPKGRHPDNKDKPSVLPSVGAGNDKFKKGVIEEIINDAYEDEKSGDNRKVSNLPTVIE